MMPELTGDGVLLAGESAMMCVNLGYQVRGMDYAIAAGQMAGIEAARAIDAGDTSKAGLAGYVCARSRTASFSGTSGSSAASRTSWSRPRACSTSIPRWCAT